MKYILALILCCVFHSSAFAVQPDEMLSDPKLEERARSISEALRCLVCQNQSIDDSEAELARDFRVLVRQRLKEGESDDAIKQFLVDRYGDYVLLDPPVKASTYALWFAPAVFLLLGLVFAVMVYRRPKTTLDANDPPLSIEQRRRIIRLLSDKSETKDIP